MIRVRKTLTISYYLIITQATAISTVVDYTEKSYLPLLLFVGNSAWYDYLCTHSRQSHRQRHDYSMQA